MSADGHVRLCAGCNRDFYLPWVPVEIVWDPPAWFCNACRMKETK